MRPRSTAVFRTSDGRSSAFSMSMVRPRFSRSIVLPLSSSSTISSNRRATRSASLISPDTVISLPRTWIETGKAPSTRRNNSSRCPNRLTMRWLPGTSTLTWVC